MVSVFWIVAGVNGAGKTTVANGLNFLIGDIAVLNPDRPVPCIHRELAGVTREEANLAAVTAVEAVAASRISKGESVGVETVLSSLKFEKHLTAAKQAGMVTGMIYVCLPTLELSIQRVADRVLMGGHDVPAHKIRERWGRSLDNAVRFLRYHIDVGYVFSNGDPLGRPTPIARSKNGDISVIKSGIAPDFDRRIRGADFSFIHDD